jgi:hypothetical protein
MVVKSTSGTATRSSKPGSGFQRYDRCRFAIFLNFEQGRRRMFGVARYERDDLLGNILRFALETDDPGEPELIIAEQEWNGLITPDQSNHCDYCLTLVVNEPAAPQTTEAPPRVKGTAKKRGNGKRRRS